MKSGANYIVIAKVDVDISLVDSAVFTFASSNKVIKEYPTDVQWDKDKFIIPLYQEDTMVLDGYVLSECQINFKDGSVLKTDISRFKMDKSLNTKVIEGNTPSSANVQDISFEIIGNAIIAKVEGDISPEDIENAVNKYLDDNPITAGISEEECQNIVASYVEENKDKLKGERGDKGEKGDAFTFADFTPTQLDSLKVKGDKGDKGYTPQKGIDYFDGKNGSDGYTPQKGVDYFDGKDGKNGVDGKDLTLPNSETISSSNVTLEWDKAYVAYDLDELDFALAELPNDNAIHDITLYLFCNTVATSLLYGTDILWNNELVTDVGYAYEININSLKLAMWAKFGGE